MVCFQSAAADAITLDGLAGVDEWDPSSFLTSDPLDVFLTDTGVHPHDSPTYARSGYDATGLWAKYQETDDRWYFRIDVDGHAGDSDSQVGTVGNPGVGTHGFDGGPLVALPSMDQTGIGPSEAYLLHIQRAIGGTTSTAIFGGNSALLPGGVFTSMGLQGSAAYGTSVNPGVIEWAFDRSTIFNNDDEHNRLWISVQMGDSNDRVSDDEIDQVLVVGQDVQVQCGERPLVVGGTQTFEIQYSEPVDAIQGISNVIITVPLPAGTSFLNADNGGTLAGGKITWVPGNLNPGDTGNLHFTLSINNNMTSLPVVSEMDCLEGLHSTSTCTASVTQSVPALGETGLMALFLILATAAILIMRRVTPKDHNTRMTK